MISRTTNSMRRCSLAGLGCEPVGVAGRADVAGELVALAADAEAARQQVVAGLPELRLGLPGEQRLVHLDPAAVEHGPVDDDLVAGAHVHDVTADDVLGRHLDVPAVADHGDGVAAQQLEPVERALGADLLDGADRRVDQAEADADEGIVVPAEGQERGADGEQDRVVEVEDVGPQDPAVAARGPADRDVALAAPVPGAGLLLGQAVRDVGLGRLLAEPRPHVHESVLSPSIALADDPRSVVAEAAVVVPAAVEVAAAEERADHGSEQQHQDHGDQHGEGDPRRVETAGRGVVQRGAHLFRGHRGQGPPSGRGMRRLPRRQVRRERRQFCDVDSGEGGRHPVAALVGGEQSPRDGVLQHQDGCQPVDVRGPQPGRLRCVGGRGPRLPLGRGHVGLLPIRDIPGSVA
jgi:hypothetical protein